MNRLHLTYVLLEDDMRHPSNSRRYVTQISPITSAVSLKQPNHKIVQLASYNEHTQHTVHLQHGRQESLLVLANKGLAPRQEHMPGNHVQEELSSATAINHVCCAVRCYASVDGREPKSGELFGRASL